MKEDIGTYSEQRSSVNIQGGMGEKKNEEADKMWTSNKNNKAF